MSKELRCVSRSLLQLLDLLCASTSTLFSSCSSALEHLSLTWRGGTYSVGKESSHMHVLSLSLTHTHTILSVLTCAVKNCHNSPQLCLLLSSCSWSTGHWTASERSPCMPQVMTQYDAAAAPAILLDGNTVMKILVWTCKCVGSEHLN